MFKPLPHPTTECPFYRGGWQNFLIATQPDSTGKPALVTDLFPAADAIFTPKNAPTGTLSYLGDVKQAGLRETLIDQNGNTLYYSIEVNPAFADFIKQNGLTTSKAIQAYPTATPNLFFPPGVAEFKAAWQLVEGDQATIDAATQNYISFKTTIPTLRQTTDANGNKQIIEDRTVPISATVRLLAIHVVFTLPGHPEFIWASFEHTTGPPDSGAADGHRDLAPTFEGANPSDADKTNHLVTTPAAMAGNYLLYKDGTPVNASNASISENSLNLTGQKFMDPSGGPQTTPIYRMFPASKSNTTDPDDAVTSLNHNVESGVHRRHQHGRAAELRQARLLPPGRRAVDGSAQVFPRRLPDPERRDQPVRAGPWLERGHHERQDRRGSLGLPKGHPDRRLRQPLLDPRRRGSHVEHGDGVVHSGAG